MHHKDWNDDIARSDSNWVGLDGEPTLLSFDDARTLFHELGHGLHGLLSDVTYMPQAVEMRYCSPHFYHAFAGDGYASACYSYLWSGVLDSDGFETFAEAGDIFNSKIAENLRKFIYSNVNRQEAAQAYRHFRGHDPNPMLC